jgi:ATP-dependent DNA helicase RecQ
LPWSIEAFYQEAGRAGRDGKEADCIILYSPETVSPAILNEIFDLNTNIPRMEELQNHLNSDLSPIMFLWRQNNDGVEKELELMRWVMLKLWNQKNSIIQCDQEHKKSKVEKAIYRLAILGFIEDWVILDWGEKTGVLEISVNNYNKETVKDHFQKYISRYESLFFSQEHANRNKAYHRIIKDKDERYYVRYMRAMLEWTYDHIAYSRRQAINHIRILCDRKLNSERLKLHINNYLQFSETTKLFDRIIEKPIDYKNWFLLLYDEVKPGELKSEGKQISVDKAENILASLQRYLESYRYNPGLNLLFVLLSIKCGQFWESGVYSRLEDAFITIESFGFETRNEIIDECLKFGVLLEDEKGKAILGEYFARGYPDKAMEIFEKLGDYGSFSVLLSRFAGKVGDTWKSII